MANPNPSPATRFKPGQVTNPHGRPKRREVIDAMLAELRAKPPGEGRSTNARLLAATAVRQAIGGDVAWARLVLEYVYGKPTQPVEVEVLAYAERVAAIIGVDPAEIISLAERRRTPAG